MISQRRTKKMQLIKIFSTIFVTFLMFSALTIVPQVNGKPIMDKINQKEEIQTLVENIEETMVNSTSDDSSILNNLLMQLLSIVFGDMIDIEMLTNLFNGDSESSILTTIFNMIKGIIQNEDGTNDNSDPTENTILNIILTLLKSIFSITMTLLKILANATISLIWGILRVIGAIVTIILLFLVGTQTVLTLGAVLMLFLGIMSKYGIKALSVIGAPIFAMIAAQATISLGTIIGGISQVIFSVLAILLLFALPIGIGAAIYLLLGGTDEGEGEGLDLGDIDLTLDDTGLLYMILSNIGSKLSQ